MSKLTDNLDANFKLFIEEVRESGQVWGLRYGEDWVVCRSAEFEDADVMPLWSAEVDARLHCVDEWADYEPEVIELEEFLDIWINGPERGRCADRPELERGSGRPGARAHRAGQGAG